MRPAGHHRRVGKGLPVETALGMRLEPEQRSRLRAAVISVIFQRPLGQLELFAESQPAFLDRSRSHPRTAPCPCPAGHHPLGRAIIGLGISEEPVHPRQLGVAAARSFCSISLIDLRSGATRARFAAASCRAALRVFDHQAEQLPSSPLPLRVGGQQALVVVEIVVEFLDRAVLRDPQLVGGRRRSGGGRGR